MGNTPFYRRPGSGPLHPVEANALTQLARKGATTKKATTVTPAPPPAPGGNVIGTYTVTSPLVLAGKVISLPPASAVASGYLSFSDWAAFNSKEPALGNPTTDGYVLSSTATGVRSWIAMSGGGGGAGIPGMATFHDPGSVAGWTWVNQTDLSTTAQAIYYNSGLSIYAPVPSTTNMDNRRILLQSLPSSGPWTITAAITGQVYPANYYNFGVVIYNSTNGRHISFVPVVEQGAIPLLALVKYSTVHQGGSGDGAYINFINAYGMWISGVVWYRVTDDGTTRNFFISNNGVVWVQIYSASSADYGPMDSAGFCANPVNGGGGAYDVSVTLLSWHIDNSILGPTTPA